MIPPASTIVQTDTLPGRRRAFGISDPRWVMRSLADLYSNKELAVTREYSTNARDAMVEAGKSDQAIEVTLPSMMNPYFKVRDFGAGMSADTLLDVYTQFGESSKRHSDDYNGMLGFGCKSAIAYTESFTVISIHNGIKSVAVITRSPDYNIEMNVVSETPSAESSGTEVTVPVHNWQEFAQKATDFYKFWLPGTVLVNGAFPAHAVGEKLAEGLYYSADNSYYNGTSYVVMGNVAYRINNPEALFRDARMNRIHFVAYVPNGAVEFTPAREDLKYTDLTKDTLHKVIKNFEDQIIATAKAEIARAKTHFDAYAKWSEWTSKLGKALFAELDFNGDKFEDDFKINGYRYQYGSAAYRINTWSVSSMDLTMVITGYERAGSPSSTDKARVREYKQLTSAKNRFFLFTNEKVTSPWVDTSGGNFVDWEDLRSALPKKPRQPRTVFSGPGRIPGTFDYWTKDGFVVEEEIPDNKTVYFVRAKEVRPVKDSVLDIREALTVTNDDGVVVLLARNRVDKFRKDNPQAIDFLPFFKSKVATDGSTLLSADAKRALAIGSETSRWINQMDVSKIDDPRFKELSTLMKTESALLKSYKDNETLAVSLDMRYDVKRHTIQRGNDSLLKEYPLLGNMRFGYSVNMEHTYIYLNAAYAAKKGN